MINDEVVNKVIEAVHKSLNYNAYNSTIAQQNTNCYSHAIGSTVHCNKEVYRIGTISGKNVDEYYFTQEELKALFLSDLARLKLDVEELNITKTQLIGDEINYLDNNQHIVVLFAQQRKKDDIIREFHFLRYDNENGWTEKRWGYKPFAVNVSTSWPDYWPNVQIGIFRISR